MKTYPLKLRRRGITAVTVRDLGLLGDSDENHLARATKMGYVLCTFDNDYLIMASKGIEHTGIVFGVQEKHTIGDWVNSLELLCTVYEPEGMNNNVEYL
jgi:hypothetical protein